MEMSYLVSLIAVGLSAESPLVYDGIASYALTHTMRSERRVTL